MIMKVLEKMETLKNLINTLFDHVGGESRMNVVEGNANVIYVQC